MAQVVHPYALAIVLNEKNQVLLIYRSNTQWLNNHYGLIGGSIEENEPASKTVMRELFEEANITTTAQDLEFAHVIHFNGATKPCVSFVFLVHKWHGEIMNKEPHKHDHLMWFQVDKLPDNLVPRHRKILELYHKNIFYSEDSW
jgi:mutator protein MutT